MTGLLWPLLVREAAEAIFGGAIHNPSGRTFKAIDIRVQHAFKVWGNRYALNPAQHEYAGVLLAWAMRKAWNPEKPYPYNLKAVTAQMERVVNDPDGHEGFKRRAELVDVRASLGKLVAA